MGYIDLYFDGPDFANLLVEHTFQPQLLLAVSLCGLLQPLISKLLISFRFPQNPCGGSVFSTGHFGPQSGIGFLPLPFPNSHGLDLPFASKYVHLQSPRRCPHRFMSRSAEQKKQSKPAISGFIVFPILSVPGTRILSQALVSPPWVVTYAEESGSSVNWRSLSRGRACLAAKSCIDARPRATFSSRRRLAPIIRYHFVSCPGRYGLAGIGGGSAIQPRSARLLRSSMSSTFQPPWVFRGRPADFGCYLGHHQAELSDQPVLAASFVGL